MKQNKHWLDRMAERADLPGEAGPAQTIVELLGDGRVLVENHQGVIGYGREKICVRVKFGTLVIVGSAMTLARMTKEQLIICGKICSVELHRKGEP